MNTFAPETPQHLALVMMLILRTMVGGGEQREEDGRKEEENTVAFTHSRLSTCLVSRAVSTYSNSFNPMQLVMVLSLLYSE